MDLTVKNLSIVLNKKTIVKEVSLKVKKGQFVGIIGANGSGKSTLLKALSKNIKPQQGEIFLGEENLLKTSAKKISQKLGVVSQFNQLSFDLTVWQMVLLGRTPHKKMLETENKQDFAIVEEALTKTNLLAYKDRSFLSLSGGEKQRVVLARTLAQEPAFLILDEPTNHLDVRFQLEILETVKKLQVTVLAVLHDLESVAHYCDYVYALKEGQVIAQGPPAEIFCSSLIEELYQVKCQIFENPLTEKMGFNYYL